MFSPSFRSVSAVFLVSAALIATAQDSSSVSRERIEQALHGIDHGRYLGQVAVSPDGKRLAWIQGARGGPEIRVAQMGELTQYIRVTAASSADEHCHETDPVWSPDSSALAFFSDCGAASGETGLYLVPSAGGSSYRLADLKGDVGAPAFSPDGRSIAFLYVEGATRPAGALAAMKAPSGVIGEEGIEVQRIAAVTVPPDWNTAPAAAPDAKTAGDRPLGSRSLTRLEPLFSFLTPANLHVYEFDWAPDSKSLAYIAADPPGENNWWVARLYAERIGSAPAVVLDPVRVSGPLHGLQMAVPRWSPNGSTIAFIGGLMSDQGVTGGDLWTVPLAGGQPTNLTPGRTSTPAWLTWSGNRTIFATEIAGGSARLVRFKLNGDAAARHATVKSATTLFTVPGHVSDGRQQLSLSSTQDGALFVFGSSTFSSPQEIYSVRMDSASSSPVRLTHLNDGLAPGWGKTVSLDWTSGPFHVQGWLMLPKDYDRKRKYPLIVEVHGGPASAVLGRWAGGGGLNAAAFSALGYFVLMPNPRGSFGQGEAFTQANRKDFGYGDLKDILAGVDTAVKNYPIDPDRVGLTGWSYGGFMTMFAVTQTHRFRAAVVGAGISDWLSYYGENSIDQWMIPYFGASVYDDPAAYAKSSAITYIKQARTPTLAVVGDRDGECPAPQSFEFWHALRAMHVPAQLVVYPNEGHGFTDPVHTRDVMERAAGWFARYMPPNR